MINEIELDEFKVNYVTEIFPAYEEYLQPARFKVAYGGRVPLQTS